MRVATVHLESLDNAPIRAAQLDTIFPLLDVDSCEHATLMGDFNFDARSEENVRNLIGADPARAAYIDAWPYVCPTDDGLTMPGESRIDRVLLRSPLLVPVRAHLLGTEPIVLSKKKRKRDSTVIRPSDHFGLLVEFAEVSRSEK
jgi:endonuclease/exonuclease/phosphatase family metal-dependent hydrolase